MLLANVAAPLVGLTQPAEAAAPVTIEDKIVAKAEAAGVDGQLAAKIAFCESSWRQFDEETGEPLRGVHNPQDVGLFQINEQYHLAKSQALGYDIYTTDGNLDYALYLLKEDGPKHWHWSKGCWNQDLTSDEIVAKK